MNIIVERYEIAIERIRQMPEESKVEAPFALFFKTAARKIITLDRVYRLLKEKKPEDFTLEQ